MITGLACCFLYMRIVVGEKWLSCKPISSVTHSLRPQAHQDLQVLVHRQDHGEVDDHLSETLRPSHVAHPFLLCLRSKPACRLLPQKSKHWKNASSRGNAFQEELSEYRSFNVCSSLMLHILLMILEEVSSSDGIWSFIWTQ